MTPQLTSDELHALKRFAKEHGSSWKQDLRDAWMNGETTGTLHRLRTAEHFGPAGLAKFRLPLGEAAEAKQSRLQRLMARADMVAHRALRVGKKAYVGWRRSARKQFNDQVRVGGQAPTTYTESGKTRRAIDQLLAE